MDAFTQFECEGWKRVADKYDSVWSSSTRQFIPLLLDAAEVSRGMLVLDVGCGPGYVAAAAAKRGAVPTGLDFSKEMIAIARRMFPQIEFREGDAQNLPFADGTFDRVLANFALLHLSDPERACAEACRGLKPGGSFAFTVWAQPAENALGKIINDAVEAHADLEVDLPPGPPFYLFASAQEAGEALERAGFDAASLAFKVHSGRWTVPTARFVFDAERNAGVRTAGLLARQTSDRLGAIESAIEEAVEPYADGDAFTIPTAAYVIAARKK
jgi:SAM-dependent methyltransferase